MLNKRPVNLKLGLQAAYSLLLLTGQTPLPTARRLDKTARDIRRFVRQ